MGRIIWLLTLSIPDTGIYLFLFETLLPRMSYLQKSKHTKQVSLKSLLFYRLYIICNMNIEFLSRHNCVSYINAESSSRSSTIRLIPKHIRKRLTNLFQVPILKRKIKLKMTLTILSFHLWKGLFRYQVFLYRAFILEQSSLD